jgi:hypothetical protein
MNTLQLSTKLGKISELKTLLSNKEKSNESLLQLFDKFSTTKILSPLESIKSKGISTKSILLGLLLMRLLTLTVRSLVLSGQHKDTYCRLKNNESIDWRKFIYSYIQRYFHLIKKYSNLQEQGTKCLIIDDSLLEKTGKRIEFIGKVFDHITKRTMLGFRILLLGYWDGVTMNPIDFSFHRKKGKNKSKPYGLKNKELALRFDKKRDNTTAGSKRVKELDIDKISNTIKMIKRAVKHGIIFQYVLMDSWFVTEKMIKAVRALKHGKIHLLGMSKMDKRKYNYNGKNYTASELLKKKN